MFSSPLCLKCKSSVAENVRWWPAKNYSPIIYHNIDSQNKIKLINKEVMQYRKLKLHSAKKKLYKLYCKLIEGKNEL